MGQVHSHNKVNRVISLLFLFLSLIYLSFSVHYFATGYGGEELLAVTLVPLALALYWLDRLKEGRLYPRLSFRANVLLAVAFVALCIFISVYMRVEYINLLMRAGAFNLMDTVVAIIIFILIMEYARREHKVLLFLNIALALYCVYGFVFPGVFWVPGVSWLRIIESSTIEIKLGVFGTYAQIGVSVLGAFLLMQGVAVGFGVQDSIVRTLIYTFARRKTLIPQTAVVSSMCVGMVSGSGSANVAATGQFTIPLMKRYGFPPHYAGAVEAASSLGGLIMPPVMAAAAFLMANILGVSYWEVVVRGFAPAIVYYGTIAFSVYLNAIKYSRRSASSANDKVELPKPTLADVLKSLAFFACIALLCYLMGVLWRPVEISALCAVIVLLSSALITKVVLERPRVADLALCLRNSVENFVKIAVELLLLLGVLGVLINLFTVSGWSLKLGMALISVGRENALYVILLAFAVGVFLGLGLPPSATYLLAAVIIAPPMIELGFNPWVVHFFAFFLGLISEYTPPTSLTAAVASRLAGADLMKTMYETARMSIPVFVLSFSIFKWQNLVVEPGLTQLLPLAMVLLGCLGLSTSFYSSFSKNRFLDMTLRVATAIVAFFVLLYPDPVYTWFFAPPILLLIIAGTYRTLKVKEA
jgi:TRAP transporter 4TM/12TM fusion protein